MKICFLNLLTHWPEASRKKFRQYRIICISITKASAKSTEKKYFLLQALSLYQKIIEDNEYNFMVFMIVSTI